MRYMTCLAISASPSALGEAVGLLRPFLEASAGGGVKRISLIMPSPAV
jgi:hypothetical protein